MLPQVLSWKFTQSFAEGVENICDLAGGEGDAALGVAAAHPQAAAGGSAEGCRRQAAGLPCQVEDMTAAQAQSGDATGGQGWQQVNHAVVILHQAFEQAHGDAVGIADLNDAFVAVNHQIGMAMVAEGGAHSLEGAVAVAQARPHRQLCQPRLHPPVS